MAMARVTGPHDRGAPGPVKTSLFISAPKKAAIPVRIASPAAESSSLKGGAMSKDGPFGPAIP